MESMQRWARLWSGLLCLLVAPALLCLTPVVDGDEHTIDCYDQHFKQYGERYFAPEVDWRYFKTQAITESRLKKKALSHDGAMGILQILPSMFDEIRSKSPLSLTIGFIGA
jgi:hypothetical protein